MLSSVLCRGVKVKVSFLIYRYHLKGVDEGKTEVFVDNLPGLPDNIRPSSHGGYWVGIAVVRKEPFMLDLLMHYPRARSLIAKVLLDIKLCLLMCWLVDLSVVDS